MSELPPVIDPASDDNRLMAERRSKLDALRAAGGIAFPNDFRPDAFAGDLQVAFADAEKWDAAALDAHARVVRVAGRLMAKRVMGKASFVQIRDLSGDMQL